MFDARRYVIQKLLQEYDTLTSEGIQDMLKYLLDWTIKEIIESEIDEHLGYGKSDRHESNDYINGYKSKVVNSSYGHVNIEIPQDLKSTFEPQIIRKYQKGISDID